MSPPSRVGGALSIQSWSGLHGELSPSHPESLPSVPPFLPVVLGALGHAEGNSDNDLFHTPRSRVHKAQRNIRGEKCSRYAGCFHQNVAIQHLLSQAASQGISCGVAQHFAHPDHRVVSSSISSFRLRIMNLFAFKTCNKRNPRMTQRLPSIAPNITPPSPTPVSFSLNRCSPHAAQHMRRINGETSPEIQQLKHMLVYTKFFHLPTLSSSVLLAVSNSNNAQRHPSTSLEVLWLVSRLHAFFSPSGLCLRSSIGSADSHNNGLCPLLRCPPKSRHDHIVDETPKKQQTSFVSQPYIDPCATSSWKVASPLLSI